MSAESAVPSNGPGESTDSGARRPFYKNPFLWGFLIGITALTVMRPIALSFRSAPPPLLEVGDWTLVSHEGVPFGSKDLAGKVYIANFIFTSCPSICPELTRAMQKLEDRIGDIEEIRFVSFSVDPETDTPEKLRAYREKYGIKTDHWIFLTGTREQMLGVLSGQMKLHVGEKQPIKGLSPEEAAQRELYDISHIGKLALFDQNGDLRALADTDAHGLARIRDAAELLVEKGPDA